MDAGDTGISFHNHLHMHVVEPDPGGGYLRLGRERQHDPVRLLRRGRRRRRRAHALQLVQVGERAEARRERRRAGGAQAVVLALVRRREHRRLGALALDGLGRGRARAGRGRRRGRALLAQTTRRPSRSPTRATCRSASRTPAPAAVFKGAVRAIHHTVAGKTRVVASNGGAVLAAFRLDQGYEQQSAGDIVRDLAGKARPSTRERSTTAPRCPYYVVDSRSTAWEHVARLAALVRVRGLARRRTARSISARCRPASPVQTFTYGEDVLELDALEAPPLPGTVTVVGEGAAGSQGSDAWSWHVKDASRRDGHGRLAAIPRVLVPLGALRSADAGERSRDRASPRRRSSAA